MAENPALIHLGHATLARQSTQNLTTLSSPYLVTLLVGQPQNSLAYDLQREQPELLLHVDWPICALQQGIISASAATCIRVS